MKYFIFVICLSVLLLPVMPVVAQNSVLKEAATLLNNVGEAAYGVKEAPKLPAVVGKIINIFLSILGILFVVLLVYGGYLWMTSYGDEKKVTKAKSLITDATIGLIIILIAYAVASFVVTSLETATTGAT
jgi:hypothetical protein